MSQYDVPENDAREIMLLPKEGEPTDWIANDGSENVISIAFPAVVTKGPPLSGLKVVFDYKYPRDIPGERIRATLFQETGKKETTNAAARLSNRGQIWEDFFCSPIAT